MGTDNSNSWNAAGIYCLSGDSGVILELEPYVRIVTGFQPVPLLRVPLGPSHPEDLATAVPELLLLSHIFVNDLGVRSPSFFPSAFQ